MLKHFQASVVGAFLRLTLKLKTCFLVAPTVRLQNVVTPLQADISQTAVAECSAAGGNCLIFYLFVD